VDKENPIEWEALLEHFQQVQDKHQEHRRKSTVLPPMLGANDLSFSYEVYKNRSIESTRLNEETGLARKKALSSGGTPSRPSSSYEMRMSANLANLFPATPQKHNSITN